MTAFHQRRRGAARDERVRGALHSRRIGYGRAREDRRFGEIRRYERNDGQEKLDDRPHRLVRPETAAAARPERRIVDDRLASTP